MQNLDNRVKAAVKYFWVTRSSQARKQTERGIQDQGSRSQVTGGKQMDGFVQIIVDTLQDCGLSSVEIFYNSHLGLPGYYRPEKKWDVLAVANEKLVAAIELKSQVGSFGNNFNNRTEEAIGNAVDLWTAYREGKIPATPKPWLGFLMLLEKSSKSTKPVRVYEPHFEVFPEFKGASYAERYRILFNKRLSRIL